MTTTSEPASQDETPDLDGAYPQLSPGQIEALAALGERRDTQAGEVLYEAGDTSCDFFAILAGAAPTRSSSWASWTSRRPPTSTASSGAWSRRACTSSRSICAA